MMSPLEHLLEFAADTSAELAACDGVDVSPSALAAAALAVSLVDGDHGGINLRGRDLRSASLRSSNLTHANLAGADLSDAVCSGTDLSFARLEAATLTRTDFAGATLKAVTAGEANFHDAMLEDAVLVGAQMRFADFSKAILDSANLSEADLWGSRFHGAAAERALFRNATMDESNLSGTELSGADFTGATLRRADLSHAHLSNTDLRDAVLDAANLANADLSGSSLPNLSLSNCDLTHVRFAGAWLDRTRFRAHQLGGCVGEEAQGDLPAAVDSYSALERNFASLGSSDDASWAYLRRRRVGRRLHGIDARQAWRDRHYRVAAVQFFLWLGDVLAEWLCDYGESLFRVARAFVVILVGFAAIYWLTGCLRPRSGIAVLHPLMPVNYLIFSLDSMTTVGTSEVALQPSGELGILLSSLQTVLGTVLLGLFGFVLGARIRR